jgi:hypothetical protein
VNLRGKGGKKPVTNTYREGKKGTKNTKLKKITKKSTIIQKTYGCSCFGEKGEVQ